MSKQQDLATVRSNRSRKPIRNAHLFNSAFIWFPPTVAVNNSTKSCAVRCGFYDEKYYFHQSSNRIIMIITEHYIIVVIFLTILIFLNMMTIGTKKKLIIDNKNNVAHRPDLALCYIVMNYYCHQLKIIIFWQSSNCSSSN